MKKLKREVRGWRRVEICGAFPEAVLNACALQAIELWDMQCVDGYTLRFCAYEQRMSEIESIARQKMCEIKSVESGGGRRVRVFLRAHLWAFEFCIFVLALLIVSSFFIWDIDVYGCEKLTEGEILRSLSECGVDCGTYWPAVNTDLVRAQLLTRLPELAWMTVNVSGSRAVVLAVERTEKPEIYIESDGADIVAAKTGIIRKLSVLNGTPAVGAGQSVTAGETLISGGMDSISNGARTVRARGEVTAETWYELSAVRPAEESFKQPRGAVKRRFALKLGKNRFNFYFDSGNTVDGCDKIIHNYKLGVDGLFALPVTLVVEELRRYDVETGAAADADAVGKRLGEYLRCRVDGNILGASVTCAETGGVSIVTLRAHCVENIALVREYAP